MATKWGVVSAEPPNKNKFYRILEKGLVKEVAKQPKLDYESIIATWDHKPTILVKFEEKPNEYNLFIGVESNWSPGKDATPEDILMFLSRGTSVRYATMTGNFSPKTSPGLIGSRGGSGGLLKVDTANPRRGIKARKYEEEVAKKNQNTIVDITQETFNKAAEDSGWTL